MKSFALAALAGSAAAAPFAYPLPNGFPELSPDAVKEVQKIAGGPLPNTPLPSEISDAVVTSFQLIAANEIFEVAYFTELYNNITNGVPGYEVPEEDKEYVEGAIQRIQNQEQLHATGANAILKTAGKQTVGPCKYQFPVSDYKSAIKLANTFTDVVLGVLPAVQYVSGTNGGAQGANVIPLLGSIIAQEAEQVGWFRTVQDKFPSAAPFLSPTTPQFALSAVAMFLVPDSCPPEYAALEQQIKPFPPLAVVKEPTEECQRLTFAVTGEIKPEYAVAYISGQSKPVIGEIGNIRQEDGKTLFDAPFPAEAAPFADGLTVAAIVPNQSPLANATEVAAATLFGPGLIEYM